MNVLAEKNAIYLIEKTKLVQQKLADFKMKYFDWNNRILDELVTERLMFLDDIKEFRSVQQEFTKQLQVNTYGGIAPSQMHQQQDTMTSLLHNAQVISSSMAPRVSMEEELEVVDDNEEDDQSTQSEKEEDEEDSGQNDSEEDVDISEDSDKD
jgi:hypothetical protein